MNAVYIIIAEAVYDHGVHGVFDGYDEAWSHALTLMDESDLYHDLRIERWEVGEAPVVSRVLRPFGDTEGERRRFKEKRDRRIEHDFIGKVFFYDRGSKERVTSHPFVGGN